VSSRRTLILVAAIAIGAIASFMVWQVVGGIEEKAYDDAERVQVFVVRNEVVKGTFGEEARTQKTVVEDEIPKKFYPPNAIRSLTDIEGKQAINNLAANQIVTTDMFADPAVVKSSFADRLDKINDTQQVAMTVSVDPIHGVAGLLQPGDYVNILVTDVCENPDGTKGTAGAEDTGDGADAAATDPDEEYCSKPILFRKQNRILYQKVQILAIGKTPVPQAGEVAAASADGAAPVTVPLSDTGMITLIVPVEAAQYISSVSERLYLTLVGDDYVPDPSMGPIDPTRPLPGEDPSKITPYGNKGAGEK
jgi:Flp pilus assembly protein CpaB